MQEDWFAVFKFRDTVRAYLIKYDLFLQYLLNCLSFRNQIWMVYYYKLECFA